jgi:putative SOS response-associated peptidase YedK
VKDGELFAFAGLWDGWKDASRNWVRTCSILTTMPNALTSIDDRMPVILDPASYDLWFDPGMTDRRRLGTAEAIRRKCDEELLGKHPDQPRGER